MKKINLTGWIFIALFAGAVTGEVYRWNHPDPETRAHFASNISILSDIFLRFIKMIIAPLVFSTLVVGIAKLGDFKAVGRIGIKTILYFQFATLLALTLGLIIVNVFKPGFYMHLEVPASTAHTNITTAPITLKDFVSHVIPKSIIEAMANNEILPIVVFSLFFGVAVAAVGDIGKPIVKAMDALAHVMFKVTNYVMKFAPIGVFGAICAVIAQQGIEVVKGYFYLIACFYGGLLFFGLVILGTIAYSVKVNFIKLLGAIQEPILLAFSTASSESAFPKTVEKLKQFGCSERIISFVLPLGYSFNLDGSIMYMTFATAFIAQTYGRVLSIEEQITMMLILLVTSKGMAGVPRASLVVIAALLPQFNLPEAGLLLLLGIDQLLDMGRSATNVIGNAVATVVVSKWEGELKE
ncbi:MAG: dicarboxylate/amino acid:cation symporter [Bacteroidia bacterium]